MNLSSVLNSTKTISGIAQIFELDVKVELGCLTDSVTIKGYKGAVTTDAVMQTVGFVCNIDPESLSKARLAKLLAKKIFKPLRVLVEAPENQCRLYQLTALSRWCSRAQAPEFGTSVALRHAMILGFLDEKYKTW